MDNRRLLVEELARAGNKKAILEMAEQYIDNRSETLSADKAKLMSEALIMLANDEDALEDDIRRAALLLGVMYYNGRGIEQNYKEAIKWYKIAADKLDSYALCNLGYCYFYGRDVEVDYEKAYSYFSQSALLGNPNAMYKLGDMFMEGKHVDLDERAGHLWYTEAYHLADRGHYVEKPNIAYRVGKTFSQEYGTAYNPLIALRFLHEAELGLFTLIAEGNSNLKPIVLEVIEEINDLTHRLFYAN